MSLQKRIDAMTFALECMRASHSAAISEPGYTHDPRVEACNCGFGRHSRTMTAMRGRAYGALRRQRALGAIIQSGGKTDDRTRQENCP